MKGETKDMIRKQTDKRKKKKEIKNPFEIWANADLTSVTVLLSKARRLQEGHLSVCIQVFLVATQDNNNVGARQSPCICQPVGEGIICLPTVRQNRWTMASLLLKGQKIDL